ncbi:MAG: ATP-binding protein [Motiliproteus sp.]
MRILPRSLIGRMVALLLLALVAVQLINVLIFFKERRDEVRAAQVSNLIARSASIVRLLNSTPAPLHGGILTAITTPRMHFWLSTQSPLDASAALQESARTAPRLSELVAQTEQELRFVTDQDHQAGGSTTPLPPHDPTNPPLSGPPMATLSIQLPTGNWLNAVQSALDPLHGWAWTLFMSLCFMASAVLIVVLLLRRITQPLARLSDQIDRFGRGEAVDALTETGAEDVRRSIRAFNQMRERVNRFVQDRTRMLAAISHDLRTPLTSLRLQAEFIDDPQMRQRIIESVNEMQHIAEATLSFASQDAEKEPTRMIDLTALIDSLCQDLDAMNEAAPRIFFSGSERTPYACRPVALKRAVRNLIENAVNYGLSAQVRIDTSGEQLLIYIEDQGPGIQPADFERVFEPFERLEESRNADTGGIGLGLSIARSIIHAHGGEIILTNRPDGLRATIHLPKQVSDSRPLQQPR